MKTAALLVLVVAAAASVGCSARYTILTAPAVSMTDPSFDASYKATPAGRVEAAYCPGDATVVSHDNNVGLIDEAIMLAQQKSPGSRYLSDVTISRDGKCIVVEGMAMK